MLQYQEQRLMGEEQFHVLHGAVSFSEQSIELNVTPGEQREGSFTLYGADGAAATGFVLSSEPPMKVVTGTFCGAREVIAYTFDASGFAPGDQVEGTFTILSDQGEYTLPFAVRVFAGALESSLGPVRNLVHFVNLARSRWKEAVQIFYRKEFADVVAGEDAPSGKRSPLTLYRGLSARECNEHNVEEFLIESGYKRPVEFSAEPREIAMDLTEVQTRPFEGQVRIRRSGWGYTYLAVEVRGDYLACGRSWLDWSDFHEGVCMLSVTVDPLRMHAGRNYGSIVLTGAYGEPIEIPVTISRNGVTALRSLRRRQYRLTVLKMMQTYIDYRLRKIDARQMAEHMEPLIRSLKESDRTNPLTSLYYIHYLLTVRRQEDALWELQALNRRLFGLDGPMPDYSVAQFDLEDDVVYSYRMYVTILCAQGQAGGAPAGLADSAAKAIRERHRRSPGSFWITWLMLYADPEYSRRPSQMLQLLRGHYERSCRSPVLYAEVWQMIRISPSILQELGPFELQVLLFAARHGALTDSVMTRVNDLARRRKTFSQRLFCVLTMAYDAQEGNEDSERGAADQTTESPGTVASTDPADGSAADETAAAREENGNSLPVDGSESAGREKILSYSGRDTLESICTLLIRGNMTDPQYFIWYQRGVEAGLTITRLLDYYMLSLPPGYDGELPQIVLMYYSYQNTLPYPQTACLYRCIRARRHENGALYARYQERIDAFTQDQLVRRRISPDLASLYADYLSSGRALTQEAASAASAVVFTRKITAQRPGQHRAVVVYDHLLQEQYGALENGTGWIPVYGDACCIFLEDDAGNRSVADRGAQQAADAEEKSGAVAGGVPSENSSVAGAAVVPLMDAGRFLSVLRLYETGNARFEMVLSLEDGMSCEITVGSVPRWLRQACSEDVPERDRTRIRARLFTFYEKEGDAGAICALLGKARPEGLGGAARAELIRLMAVEGLFEQAFAWICRFGTDGIAGDVLLRIASGLLDTGTVSDEGALSMMAHRAFLLGNYNRTVLLQLMERWDGCTGEMEEVRQAALAFGLDTYGISTRMLTQLLFTGERLPQSSELLLCCRRGGADAQFLMAALAQNCHYSFLSGQRLTEEEIRMIGDFGMDGTPLLDICRIAWLKDRSERSGEIPARDLEITELFLTDLVGRDVVFPFFRQFAGVLPALQAYADETLFEYRAARPDPKARVLIHYATERGGIREPYRTRRMKEMYDGVYVTGFLLFFGEQLHYYVTDDPQEKNVTESGTLGQDARILTEGTDRFGKINQIAMLTALGRDEEALVLLEDYERQLYLEKQLFGE